MISDFFDDEKRPVYEEELVEVKKLSPFDFLNSINSNKPMDFSETEDVAYIPFLINRGLSYFSDTVMYANLMNQRHQLSNAAQYNFLINTVRPRKRFSKWLKKEKIDDIELIKSHFGYSDKKAMQILPLLSPEQVVSIKQQNNKGGIDNGTRKKVNN